MHRVRLNRLESAVLISRESIIATRSYVAILPRVYSVIHIRSCRNMTASTLVRAYTTSPTDSSKILRELHCAQLVRIRVSAAEERGRMMHSNGFGYLSYDGQATVDYRGQYKDTHDTIPSVISTSSTTAFPCSSVGALMLNVWRMFESMMKIDASAKSRPGQALRAVRMSTAHPFTCEQGERTSARTRTRCSQDQAPCRSADRLPGIVQA